MVELRSICRKRTGLTFYLCFLNFFWLCYGTTREATVIAMKKRTIGFVSTAQVNRIALRNVIKKSRRSRTSGLYGLPNEPVINDLYGAPICNKDSIVSILKFMESLQNGSIPTRFVSILGSTGSIGRQTLEVIDIANKAANKYNRGVPYFEVTGLASGGQDLQLLTEQINKWKPEIVAIGDEKKVESLKESLRSRNIIVVGGDKGVQEVSKWVKGDDPKKNVLVSAIVGFAGLQPTISAIRVGKSIAFANKETLISAAPVILPLVKEFKTLLIPADSEHSAIFQCLQGALPKTVRKLILTASGGAFRDLSKEELKSVTVAEALKHPNWSMGAKITVDSSSMMNKGLEVIEAHYLFGIDYADIEIVVHKESIIHSMVEFCDSTILSQMGVPDMRAPLLYALSYPHRLPVAAEETSSKTDYLDSLNFNRIKNLSFQPADFDKYPCLELAYWAGKQGGLMPTVVNAANEIANEQFRKGQISFLSISTVIRSVLDAAVNNSFKSHNISLSDVLHADLWAREKAKSFQQLKN